MNPATIQICIDELAENGLGEATRSRPSLPTVEPDASLPSQPASSWQQPPVADEPSDRLDTLSFRQVAENTRTFRINMRGQGE